jgi:ABC-2 type transport system ATP-binding protein
VSDLAIETRRLRKHYGPKVAVRDLTLSVPRGEVIGFLGPNGAGKTTSVKMLLSLVRPTSGRAMLLGAPLGDVAVRARIGFLPEHFRFHEWLTGRELLSAHGRLLGLEGSALAAQVESLLARVQLRDAAGHRLSDYSKGMQQRAGLAVALLNHPELVFLDEPTSGLDPLGRLLVRDVIQELKARGTTVFLNSHLLSEVERTCDRVFFVKAGRVVRDMRLADRERRVEVSMRLERVTPDLIEGLARFGTSPRVECGLVRLSLDSETGLPEMTRWLAARGVGLYHLSTDRPSLESVFVELMRDEPPEPVSAAAVATLPKDGS